MSDAENEQTDQDQEDMEEVDQEAMEEAHKRREHARAEREEVANLAAFGKPSTLPKEKLMRSEGIIPIQSGTNKYASQKGMTGFGRPRDVIDKVKCENLKPIEDESKIQSLRDVLPLQSGTNKYASQKGMTGFGCPRDVIGKTKGTGGTGEVDEEKAKATDGVIPLQAGTNKLASQAGMTGFGMPRSVLHRFNPDQDRQSQGFVHLQAGTNKLATQQGMTSFGSPRTNVTKYKDSQRGEMANDESVIPRQTTGYKEGANQAGMTGFGMPRNTTIMQLSRQEQKSQGLIPYQMGINWGDSQAGKTGFGMPRQVFTNYTDDIRGELPEELARMPDVPFWSGMEKLASQAGMTAMGMPRDVKGTYLRRLWGTKKQLNPIHFSNRPWLCASGQQTKSRWNVKQPFINVPKQRKRMLLAAWCLKLNCLVREVKLDEIDLEDTSIAEELMNEEVLSGMPRPETSLRRPTSSSAGMASQSIRPRTKSGRPITGVLRPESQMNKSDTLQATLRTARTSQTARPLTSLTGRFVRLGTASMFATGEGAFINVSRLNLSKYASRQEVSRPLFEYLFFKLNDAFQLALLACESTKQSDWYWKLQVGRCYLRMGQYRDAEKNIRTAHVQQASITTALHLSKVYCAIDQPLKAIEILNQALNKFNEDTTLLKALCVIEEKLNNQIEIDSLLRRILRQDSIDIEAIASVATNYFYSDLPELALRFFRRILQMGMVTTEVYLNIGLCCFNAQQFDIAVDCLHEAIRNATDEQSGDVWYNIGYVALATGDLQWAKQCFSLCLTYSGDYAEAWCNLAVIEMHEGNLSQANSLLETAMIHGSHTFEPFYNYALLQYKAGKCQSSLNAIKKSLEIYPEHTASKELFKLLSNLLIRL
ncbi:hypothetical protein M514_11552 [Trichuris suis]|uniref:Uncharacterized protein n=1 Tax=Trichuris suis TaxID=68888 RepID=A0A085N665_9BILA|nr:hypothetical protein M514_11552 [Trichuris suis]